MTKSQQLWLRAARLLSDSRLFNAERERVLTENPLLNSHGLGQQRRRKLAPHASDRGKWETELVPGDLDAARDELRAAGHHERGIRNSLEYMAEARPSLSYRLRGCGWARQINGPAPRKRSSCVIKHEVEDYLRKQDEHSRGGDGNAPSIDRHTANGAFICAALMVGLQMWVYRDSINPDFRLGRPWAVAGMQPEDFADPGDAQMARFWRWVVRHEVTSPEIERFIIDSVHALYEGADLNSLRAAVERGSSQSQDVYHRFRIGFGIEFTGEFDSPRLGFMAGQIQVPEDFDRMGRSQIEEMFGVTG